MRMREFNRKSSVRLFCFILHASNETREKTKNFYVCIVEMLAGLVGWKII